MIDQFLNEIPVAITVTDTEGKIIYMNEKSETVFEKYGGKELMGKNIFDYHNQNSCSMITKMLLEKTTNAYTIEKNEMKKMIFQSPWMIDGVVKGMVEFSFEIPVEMSHFKRS